MDKQRYSVNKDETKRQERKLLIRTLPKYILSLLLLVGIGKLSLDYLSKLPRERFAKGYSYFERVWLGTKKVAKMTALTMKASHEDPKGTKLPLVEIYIKGKRIDKLNRDLPESGAQYQKAKVKVGGKEYSAEVRYRGDSMNHWAYPNKSWRVRIAKGKFYDGMQSFNLNVPRVDTQISNWLGYKMAEGFPKLLVPEARFVHFRLNRQYDGVRLFLEQPNQEFLSRRGLAYGKIYIGDIDSSQIYGGVKRKHLYKDYTAWQVRNAAPDTNPKEIRELVRLIKDQQPNPYLFHDQMERMFDMPAMLQYMALLELIGTVHIDETHNGKYYFDPVRGKFVPIVWDTVAYMWHNAQPIDLGTNSLFRVILSNPDFRERKDEYLWSAMNGKLSKKNIISLVQEEKAKIAPDIYSFALKIHANDKGVKHLSNQQWEDAITKLTQTVGQRDGYIRGELQKTDLSYNLFRDPKRKNSYLIPVKVSSRAGVQLNRIQVPIARRGAGAARIMIERVGFEEACRPDVRCDEPLRGVVHGGDVHFVLQDRLLSKRSFRDTRNGKVVPATYLYRITVPQGYILGSDPQLTAKNAITKASFTPAQDRQLKATDSSRPYLVWWDKSKIRGGEEVRNLSGTVVLRETMKVVKGEKLVVAPGTTVRFAKGVSLLIDGGSIHSKGTKSRPVTFTAQNPAEQWGVIALREPTEALFQHTRVRGGGAATIDHVRYDGLLSLHGGKAVVEDSSFEGGYLSARFSELTLKNVHLKSLFSFALLSENAFVKEENFEKEIVPAVHDVRLMNYEGYGTPTRVEREFKWSISSDKELTLEETAEEIRKALEDSVKETPDVWQAPTHVGNQFYVDDSTADFVFRDVYFDTPDALNYKHKISYRLRNRYPSLGGYKRHVKTQDWPTAWPYRLEFQAKTNRKELDRGFSTVEEARFEFRKESLPFSEENLPPAPPWDLDEFIPYFSAGNYKGLTTYPAQAVLTALKDELKGKTVLRVEPELVLLTERFRMHLNIKSPWGSGPNPEQSYIISLDKSDIYESEPYLRYLRSRKQGLKPNAPESQGSLMEIEIEFERNVSDVLDRKITEVEAAGDTEKLAELRAVRAAFLEDQETIMKVVQKAFREQDIDLQPAQKSKYVQAYEILHSQ